MTRHIAMLGAFGAVGRAVVEELGKHPQSPTAAGRYPLRLGTRDLDAVRASLSDGPAGGAAVCRVDLHDDDALGEFCAGSAVVVNCAGPADVVGDRVARAALAAGAHYVDPGGDEELYRALTAFSPPATSPDGTALLSAGMTPGLSALLPQVLADGFDRVTRLRVYAGGLDRFTPAAAGDYIASLTNGYGRSFAAWRQGRLLAGALPRLEVEVLPYFTGAVTAHPYLSAEMERLAERLGLMDLDWYNVFVGQQVLATLGRAAQLPETEAVAELIAAADRDLLGARPFQLFVMCLDGTVAGDPVSRTLVLRALDSYRLTGCATALATAAVLEGDIPPGVHFAADVLAPRCARSWLLHSDAVTCMDTLDGAIEWDSSAEEEGTL